MRWFVGDLHGCAREFEDLLRAIRFDAARDELWLTGDVVNRGPDSLATLELWRATGGRAVRGNHDDYAVRAFHGALDGDPHPSLHGLFAHPDAGLHLDALAALPLLRPFPPDDECADPIVLVHAGVHPAWRDFHATAARLNVPLAPTDPRPEDVSFALSARCCHPDGGRARHAGLPADCPAGSRPWDDFYSGDAIVVHGHWARRGHYRRGRVIGLDSGCVYGGGLTAWCPAEDRVVTVPSRPGPAAV